MSEYRRLFFVLVFNKHLSCACISTVKRAGLSESGHFHQSPEIKIVYIKSERTNIRTVVTMAPSVLPHCPQMEYRLRGKT